MSCVVCVEYHMSKNSVENRTKSGKSGGLLIKVCNSIFFIIPFKYKHGTDEGKKKCLAFLWYLR